MANGIKRTAARDPQCRSKKAKTPVKPARHSNAAHSVSSPTKGGGEDDNPGALGADAIDETMDILKKVSLNHKKEDEWPKKFGQRLDGSQAEVLATLDAARKKLESKKTAFRQGILPLLRTALAPIDDDEAPEVEDDSILEIPFAAAGYQEYVVEITQLVKASYALVDTFDELVKQEEKIPPSRLAGLEQDFHQDEEAVLSTINAGRRVAARDVDTMLTDRYNEVRGRSNLTREDEQRGRKLLSKGEAEYREDRISTCWGDIAADARKAVHKLEKVGQSQHIA